MTDNITEHQPAIVVMDGDDNAHVIPSYLIRQVATGRHIADNELTRLMAKALIDLMDE